MLTDWLIYLDLLEEQNNNTSFLRLVTPIIFGIFECHSYNYIYIFSDSSGFGNGLGYGYDSGNGSSYGNDFCFGYSYGDALVMV